MADLLILFLAMLGFAVCLFGLAVPGLFVHDGVSSVARPPTPAKARPLRPAPTPDPAEWEARLSVVAANLLELRDCDGVAALRAAAASSRDPYDAAKVRKVDDALDGLFADYLALSSVVASAGRAGAKRRKEVTALLEGPSVPRAQGDVDVLSRSLGERRTPTVMTTPRAVLSSMEVAFDGLRALVRSSS